MCPTICFNIITFIELNKEFHIVYLTYDGLTDQLGQSQILPYLTGIHKNKQNYRFTIVSFEKKSNFLKHNQKIKIILKNIEAVWISLNYTKQPPIFSTLIDLIKLLKTIKAINSTKKINLIHCRSYITSLIGLNFKKRHRIPFIFDMRGFYADERVDGKIWKKTNIIYLFIYRYFKSKEKEFLQYSYHTISLTANAKKEIKSWNLPNQSQISVIPCCTDEELFNIKNRKISRNDIGLKKSDFIISYVGSTGTWYMVDEMLDFFKVLNEKKPNSIFLFITKDNQNLIFEKCLEKQIPKSSIIIKESSRELMPSYIGLSDFSIFFILPFYSKKASSPTKMGEIMNLGIPIICNSGVGDVDEVMERCMPELLVKNFNTQEYERIVDLLLNDFNFDSEKIIQTSHNYYSLNKGVKKYLDIYKQILK